MEKVNLTIKIITSDEGKATISNSFFKSVFTKLKNTLPDFKPVSEANISEVVFSEERGKKKLLNLNSYKSPRADSLHPRIFKELFSKFISTVIYLIRWRSAEPRVYLGIPFTLFTVNLD